VTLYLDSSALVKLYVFEEHSANVTALAQRGDVTFALNELHDLEVRNAVRLAAFRGVIGNEGQMRALTAFDADLATDLYRPHRIDFGKLAKVAERLSAAATVQIGARALDILHVAAAQLAACSAFATFDHRQRELARITGVSILELVT
jgi:predicted nucleic acid-binding protein